MATREDGYTLLELLVVVMLIAILTAIALGFNNAGRVRGGDAAARSNIRVAVPAFEAYKGDHGESYEGMTVTDLQTLYSPGVNGIVILSAGATSYCVQSTVDGRSWYKLGPAGSITMTSCG